MKYLGFKALILLAVLMVLPTHAEAQKVKSFKKSQKSQKTSDIECKIPKPANINVNPTSKEVQYDFTQSLNQIQGQAMGTLNPYSFHSATYTQGFMKGAIKMEPSVKLNGFTVPELGYACLWYEEINIDIEIDPQITIAKEVYDDKCMRKSVLAHEMKHVYADRKIVNKYSRLMGRKVYEEIKQRGFVVGPIPIAQKDAVVARMQDTVFKIVGNEYKRMELDRGDMQSEIDSLEEYERTGNKCKKENFRR